MTASLRAKLQSLAEQAGFERFGVARAELLGEEAIRLRSWLAAGYHGSMRWMADHEKVRVNPAHEAMVKDARSVIVLATRYSQRPLPEELGVRIAAYARGRDYHRVLEKRMRPLVKLLRQQGFAARSAVDSKPVFERAWAVRAGLGFIGKNCCLIVPGLGSHLFLAAVVTTAELPSDSPMGERCGTCRLCLDVCPTQAFASPRQLDSRRCISYLTIESAELPEPQLRSRLRGWAFGCDECQNVCPFNQGAQAAGQNVTLQSDFFQNERWDGLHPRDFLESDPGEFDARFAGSPLRRAGAMQMARNVALALGSQGSSARRHLPVLQRAARTHANADVRESAAWAIREIEST